MLNSARRPTVVAQTPPILATREQDPSPAFLSIDRLTNVSKSFDLFLPDVRGEEFRRVEPNDGEGGRDVQVADHCHEHNRPIILVDASLEGHHAKKTEAGQGHANDVRPSTSASLAGRRAKCIDCLRSGKILIP